MHHFAKIILLYPGYDDFKLMHPLTVKNNSGNKKGIICVQMLIRSDQSNRPIR